MHSGLRPDGLHPNRRRTAGEWHRAWSSMLVTFGIFEPRPGIVVIQGGLVPHMSRLNPKRRGAGRWSWGFSAVRSRPFSQHERVSPLAWYPGSPKGHSQRYSELIGEKTCALQGWGTAAITARSDLIVPCRGRAHVAICPCPKDRSAAGARAGVPRLRPAVLYTVLHDLPQLGDKYRRCPSGPARRRVRRPTHSRPGKRSASGSATGDASQGYSAALQRGAAADGRHGSATHWSGTASPGAQERAGMASDRVAVSEYAPRIVHSKTISRGLPPDAVSKTDS